MSLEPNFSSAELNLDVDKTERQFRRLNVDVDGTELQFRRTEPRCR